MCQLLLLLVLSSQPFSYAHFSHAQSGPWAQMVLFWFGQIRFLKSLLNAKPVRGPGGGD